MAEVKCERDCGIALPCRERNLGVVTKDLDFLFTGSMNPVGLRVAVARGTERDRPRSGREHRRSWARSLSLGR